VRLLASARRSNRLHLIWYYLVPLVAFLPAPLAYGVAVLVGDLWYRFDKLSKEIECSLQRVFENQLSSQERSRVVRDFFRLRYCEAIDAIRLAGKGRTLVRLVEIRGLEHIEAALATGKGALLCSAHFGSYNCCFSVLGSLGYPITCVTNWSYDDDHLSPIHRLFNRPIKHRPVVHHLHRPNIERRPGKFGVAVQVGIALRQNELLGTMLDHSDYADPLAPADRTRPIQIDFLNRQALMLPGAITIAQLMGAPVLMTFMRRSADWRHQILEISPPIPMEGDPVTAFRRCLAVVETAIRRNPAHWHKWNFNALVQLGLLPAEDARFRGNEKRV